MRRTPSSTTSTSWTRYGVIALVLSLTLVPPGSWASHRAFVWVAPTTNADGTPLADLAGYRLYTCPPAPAGCSLVSGGTVITETGSGVTTAPIPHGMGGQAFATAVDLSGNESAESNVVPFDALSPSAPTGMAVQ